MSARRALSSAGGRGLESDGFLERLDRGRRTVRGRLLAERTAAGHWVGELSTSALSTATAALALALADRARGERRFETLVERGLDWLARHANEDGGWGDTLRSRSNLSTTTLAWAALYAAGGERHAAPVERARAWIAARAGSLEPEVLAAAVAAVYGKDRTFSVPILMTSALAGVLGEGEAAWRSVRQLPFELAACPRAWFRRLGLGVVSYALPALIAVGLVRHRRLPGRNPLLRIAREAASRPALRLLERIQPASGGFLEAVPLSSFVVMSLAACGEAAHPVVSRSLEFLLRSVRADGSWPIDSNLATWVTTLAVNALGGGLEGLEEGGRAQIRAWLLREQHREVHPYTEAAPGGWAWTDRAGGVPDADDTAGALLALRRLGPITPACREAALLGVSWLLDLQNADGGIPTFARGWGRLAFDRSGADLTAHALRAFAAWRRDLLPELGRRLDRAMDRAVGYLADVARADGSWTPLWFGNESSPAAENPTYGTARVLVGLREIDGAAERCSRAAALERRGEEWLLGAQDPGGGWGGSPGAPPSVEETALALEALAPRAANAAGGGDTVRRGAEWLLERVEEGELEAAPIGFYFASLWYSERLYPWIFATGALERLRAELAAR
jgi:squalene-hopene/tetraprenyl-beta-curcumene cyclase